MLVEMLAKDGRFQLEMTQDLDAFARLFGGSYVALGVSVAPAEGCE